jgi:hypothetical protein
MTFMINKRILSKIVRHFVKPAILKALKAVRRYLEFKHRFRRYFFLVTTREKIVGQMMFFLCERSFLAEDIFRAVE